MSSKSFSEIDCDKDLPPVSVRKCFITSWVRSSTSFVSYSPDNIISHASVVAPKSTSTFKGKTVKGVPCAWPKCSLFLSNRYWVISSGVATTVQSVHFLGSWAGFRGTSNRFKPDWQSPSRDMSLSLAWRSFINSAFSIRSAVFSWWGRSAFVLL